MAPTLPAQRHILLIQNTPIPDYHQSKLPKHVVSKLQKDYAFVRHKENVSVGDVVILRSPLDPLEYLVRRLVALEGHEMASADAKDEGFVIQKGRCWLLSDNQNLKPQEAKDSRTFGPIAISQIWGRVIYKYHTASDHGIVENSKSSSPEDMVVLKFELDLNTLERMESYLPNRHPNEGHPS